MPLYKTYQTDEFQYAFWFLNEPLEELMAISNQIAINAINHIKTEKRKKEKLASLLLLKHLSGKNNYSYLEDGCPYVGDDFHISITHSGDYVAIALSKTRIGIDIEQISNKLERTKHKFAGITELNRSAKENSLKHLALIWSSKESAYKWFGNIPFQFDTELELSDYALTSQGHLLLKAKHKQKLATFLNIQYEFFDNYIFTIARSQ